MFEKGVSGNPAGRPKGSCNVDRMNYLDLQIWFKEMFDTLQEIESPKEKITFQLQIADKLLGKIANLPQTPKESLDNAKARQEILAALEGSNVSPVTE